VHEFNFCQTIVDAVLDRIGRTAPTPTRVLKVSVAVGALRGLVAENLHSSYALLTKGTPAEGSALSVACIPAHGTCERCGWTGDFSNAAFRCGQCGSTVGRVEGGRQLCLESMEVEEL
jgi:hydrogenase nickel incorporation protein HypA/HybF